MKCSIRSFIAKDGERISQLFADGFPLFYPTAYISRSIRPNSTHETQKVYLETIKRICEWESQHKLDLSDRFGKSLYLKPGELDSLVVHLGKRRRGKKGDVISRNKHNTFIFYAADYLTWIAIETADAGDPKIDHGIKQQQQAMSARKIRKSGSLSAAKQKIAFTHLPKSAEEVLLSLFDDPFEGINREAGKAPRLRNIVMLRILYETGMRRGELLSLKLRSFQESGGGEGAFLEIERNHSDEFDSRLRQPVAKTLGRIVPISDKAEQQLVDYLMNWRADVPHVGFSENDFLFVNHRAGRNQGKPITETTFNSAISQLKSIFPELDPIYPHLFRHDWNYRFSKKTEDWVFEKEREVREKLMGWAPGSEMSLLYNQRKIQELANQVGRLIACDTSKR